MKKVYKYLAILFTIATLVINFSLVFIAKSNGKVTEDLLGLTIPTPPEWTAYIPVLGLLLENLFELFSFHGLIVLVSAFVFGGISFKLWGLSDQTKDTASTFPDLVRKVVEKELTSDEYPNLIKLHGQNTDSLIKNVTAMLVSQYESKINEVPTCLGIYEFDASNYYSSTEYEPAPFDPIEFPTLVMYDSQKIEDAIQKLIKDRSMTRQQALVNLEQDLSELEQNEK